MTSRHISAAALLVFCLVLLQGSRVDAVQCYKCTSGCDDDFESLGVLTTNCATSCIKIKSNAGNVIRDCHTEYKNTNCDEQEHYETCFCNTDLCNGSTVPKMAVMTSLLSALVSVIWAML